MRILNFLKLGFLNCSFLKSYKDIIFCLKIKCISPSWLQKLHREAFGRMTELSIDCFNLSSLLSFPPFDVMNQFWRIKWHFLSNKEESLLVQTFIRRGKKHRSVFIYNILISIQNMLWAKHIFIQYLTITDLKDCKLIWFEMILIVRQSEIRSYTYEQKVEESHSSQ